MSLTMIFIGSLSTNHIRKYEWFKHKSTLDIIKHQIEEEFFTETLRPKVTESPSHQTEFVTRARTDYEEFLLRSVRW